MLKKALKHIIIISVSFVILTIYGYYNWPTPNYKYSWLVALIIIAIIYPIIYFSTKNKKK